MGTARATASFVSSLCIYGTIGWALAYINLPSEVVVLFRGILGTAFILCEPLSILGWLGAVLIIGAAALSKIIE